MKSGLMGAVVVLALLAACRSETWEVSDEAGGAASGGAGAATSAGKGGAGGSAGASGGASAGGGGASSQAGKSAGGTGGAVGGSAGAAGSGGAGGEGGEVEVPEALVPIVNAFCAAARACCTNEPDTDLADCEAEYPTKNAPFASLARGAVTLDVAGLEKCRAAYEAAAVSCEMNGAVAACAGLVTGKLADGAACSDGSECAATPGPNTCLITEQNGTVGICKKIPHAELGGACSLTCYQGEDCTFTTLGAADSLLDVCFEDEGLYCDYQDDSAKCATLRALGADCTDDRQCGSVNYCDYDDHKCKKRATLGEDCGYCISSLSCVNGKCKSPPFSTGSACQGRTFGPY